MGFALGESVVADFLAVDFAGEAAGVAAVAGFEGDVFVGAPIAAEVGGTTLGSVATSVALHMGVSCVLPGGLLKPPRP